MFSVHFFVLMPFVLFSWFSFFLSSICFVSFSNVIKLVIKTECILSDATIYASDTKQFSYFFCWKTFRNIIQRRSYRIWWWNNEMIWWCDLHELIQFLSSTLYIHQCHILLACDLVINLPFGHHHRSHDNLYIFIEYRKISKIWFLEEIITINLESTR